MKKMPCLFVRVFDAGQPVRLTTQVTPGCEWVLDGEGVVTRKWDGTACAVLQTELGAKALYKRYDAKAIPTHLEPYTKGLTVEHEGRRFKTPPRGAVPCCPPDPETGHWPHWVLLDVSDYAHLEAWGRQWRHLNPGTYELVGPKVSANPERFHEHVLIPHGVDRYWGVERTWTGLKAFLTRNLVEGVVFHHPDGRMAKLRRADYGLPWPLPAPTLEEALPECLLPEASK